MKIMVWNVNGIRACVRKGFMTWLDRARPGLVGLQETRAFQEQVPEEVVRAAGYRWILAPSERPGYSGVGILTRRVPRSVETSLGIPEFDREGRVLIAEFERFTFFNVYFPKGSGRDRDNSRVPFKLAFYEAVLERARASVRRGHGVVIGGDFNTAHEELDLRNWKTNGKTSGFLPEERAAFGLYLDAGFVDVFRERHPGEEGHYTWWSQRQGARARNVGWRIDYLLVSRAIAPWVRRAWIDADVPGSDHCPLGIDLVVPQTRSRTRNVKA